MAQRVAQQGAGTGAAYREALTAYQAAVEGFFGPVSPKQGPVADPVTLAGPVEETGRAFVAAAADELASGDRGWCERTRFQLLAAALADVAVGQELAAVEGLAAGTGSRGMPTDVSPATRRLASAILSTAFRKSPGSCCPTSPCYYLPGTSGELTKRCTECAAVGGGAGAGAAAVGARQGAGRRRGGAGGVGQGRPVTRCG